jgi:hypothetical protein
MSITSKEALTRPNVFQTDNGVSQIQAQPVNIRCPHCRQLGTFGSPYQIGLGFSKTRALDKANSPYVAAIHICPNTECKGLVFIIRNQHGVVRTEPPQVLDFQPDGIPEKMLATLKEAIACHAAGANRAAAMMVRRLLEEICDDNNATGRDLHQRIEAIKSSVTLPNDLFSAMFELKALGNDAAHIEAKAYDNIGPDEAEDSIELAKEILKSLYQLKGLVSRLQARRKP